MAGTTKAQLEEKVRELEKQLENHQKWLRESEARYHQLLSEKEEKFTHLPVYEQLNSKIKELEYNDGIKDNKIKRLRDKLEELQNSFRILKKENKQLQESIKNIPAISDTVHNARGAGRKPKPEELVIQQVQRIEKLLNEGKKEKEICIEMGISRATYYRLKKKIESH